MATPSFAIWGALLGWVLMPRIGRNRSSRMFRALAAYVVAILISVGVMYNFDYHRQSWLFVLGMTVQFGIFLAVSWVRRAIARSGRK